MTHNAPQSPANRPRRTEARHERARVRFRPSVRAHAPGRWLDQGRQAFRGLKHGFRGDASFFVHLFCAVLLAAGALCLRMNWLEWSLLIGSMTLILMAELSSRALEILYRALPANRRDQAWAAVEVSAASVLSAGFGAGLIGVLVFVHRLAILLHWWQ